MREKNPPAEGRAEDQGISTVRISNGTGEAVLMWTYGYEAKRQS